MFNSPEDKGLRSGRAEWYQENRMDGRIKYGRLMGEPLNLSRRGFTSLTNIILEKEPKTFSTDEKNRDLWTCIACIMTDSVFVTFVSTHKPTGEQRFTSLFSNVLRVMSHCTSYPATLSLWSYRSKSPPLSAPTSPGDTGQWHTFIQSVHCVWSLRSGAFQSPRSVSVGSWQRASLCRNNPLSPRWSASQCVTAGA